LVALSLERESLKDYFTYRDALEGFAGDTLYLLGIAIAVSDSTSFFDETGTGKTLADLAPGDPVEVKALDERGGLRALRVELKREAEGHGEVEALVTALDYAAGTMVVGGVELRF